MAKDKDAASAVNAEKQQAEAGAQPALPPRGEEQISAENAADAAALAAAASAAQQPQQKTPPQPKFLRRFGGKNKETAAPAAVKETARRSKGAHNPLLVFVNFIFMLAVFTVLLAALALYSVKALYERPSHKAEAASVLIPSGSGVRAIADVLEQRGFISNAHIFAYGAYLEDKARLLKAGEYEIPAYASMQEIADILARGRALQYSITFPEGMTSAKIFAKLAAEPLLTGSLPASPPPEGSLMTDTVKFTRGESRRAVVRRLRLGQERLVQEIWAKRAAGLPLKNPEQMVILASLVEKETGLAAERPRIAAVFYNRLRKNMRLQSDPTVLYGLFGGQGRPENRSIYRSDLEKETPYNTYKIMGLPPTPICNPGRSALLAVANPPQTEDLYFVADGAGGHIFSKTLHEHNSNVSKWRALRKAQEEQQERQKLQTGGQNRTEEKIGSGARDAAPENGGQDTAENADSPPKPVDSAQAEVGKSAASPSAAPQILPLPRQESARGREKGSGNGGLIKETP